METLKIFRV